MCHGPNSTWCKMTKHWHEYAVHKSSTPNQRCIHPLEDLLRADGWRFPSWCLCCQELNSIRDFDCFDCFSSPQPHRNDANSIKLMNKPLEFGKHWNFTSKDLFFCNVSFRQNGTFSRPNKRLSIDTDLGIWVNMSTPGWVALRGGNPFRCLGQVCFALHAGPCLYVHRPKINQSTCCVFMASLAGPWMTARLPSNPERMVPGAPVLLEPCLAIFRTRCGMNWKAQRGTVRIKRKWGKCGSGAALAATWCLRFSSFLGAALGKLVWMALDRGLFDVISKVHTVQQPFQRLLSDAVDGAVAFARPAKLESRERLVAKHLTCVYMCWICIKVTRFVAACIMISRCTRLSGVDATSCSMFEITGLQRCGCWLWG